MHQILPNLFLGDFRDAQDVMTIIRNDIRCVMNCTATDVAFAPDLPKYISRIRIPVDDNGNRQHDYALFAALPYCVNRIDIHLTLGQGVLVQCYAGVQRSACVVASYLTWKLGMTTEDAIAFVRSKRPIAFWPSANFIRCLEWWEMRCRGSKSKEIPRVRGQPTYLLA